MKKLTILSLLAFVSLSFGAYQDFNFTGYLDTANQYIDGNSSRTWTKNFSLLTAENGSIVVIAKDTSNHSALSSDSVAFFYGYKVGCFYINIAGALDTAWQKPVIIDTINNTTTTKYYANVVDLYTDPVTNSPIEIYGLIDTTNSKSIRQVHSIVPVAMPIIKFFTQPIAGCKKASKVKIRVTYTRRDHSIVHTK